MCSSDLRVRAQPADVVRVGDRDGGLEEGQRDARRRQARKRRRDRRVKKRAHFRQPNVNSCAMLGAITLLLVYQLAGEVIVQLARLPVPGPVVGMLLLFLTLVWRGGTPAGLRDTSQGLLSHLSLLFVPAGGGVLLHFGGLGAE